MHDISPRVLASGRFDLLHPGHIFYLKEARDLSQEGELWVIISNDSNTESCVLSDAKRKNKVESLGIADRVIIGRENIDMLATLREIKPDILALGYDQRPEDLGKTLGRYKGNVSVRRTEPLDPEKYSSRKIKELLDLIQDP